LGIFIEIRDGLIEVISPIAGTPAAEAGIRPGDLILAIDGQRQEFRDTADAMKVLKGEPGSEITLTVKRRSLEKSFDLIMKRAEITIDSVRAVEVLPGGIGYLLIIAFQEQTDADLTAALETLERGGAKALILDLRGNPGGLLTSATAIADIFLDPGLVLVGTKARDGIREQVLSESQAKFKDWPIAVLVDAGSASASEILGGALRDHQRAILVGERSYGKGSVQSIFDMLDGETVMKFTTAYYTTPSGRKIHRSEDAGPEEEWGLIPDVLAPASESEQIAIARWSSDRYVAELKRAAGETVELPPRPKDTALEAAIARLTAVRLGTAKLFEGAESNPESSTGSDGEK
jgi:carboxyl-terminal processing protease